MVGMLLLLGGGWLVVGTLVGMILGKSIAGVDDDCTPGAQVVAPQLLGVDVQTTRRHSDLVRLTVV